jgi:hypothetical protein
MSAAVIRLATKVTAILPSATCDARAGNCCHLADDTPCHVTASNVKESFAVYSDNWLSTMSFVGTPPYNSRRKF